MKKIILLILPLAIVACANKTKLVNQDSRQPNQVTDYGGSGKSTSLDKNDLLLKSNSYITTNQKNDFRLYVSCDSDLCEKIRINYLEVSDNIYLFRDGVVSKSELEKIINDESYYKYTKKMGSEKKILETGGVAALETVAVPMHAMVDVLSGITDGDVAKTILKASKTDRKLVVSQRKLSRIFEFLDDSADSYVANISAEIELLLNRQYINCKATRLSKSIKLSPSFVEYYEPLNNLITAEQSIRNFFEKGDPKFPETFCKEK